MAITWLWVSFQSSMMKRGCFFCRALFYLWWLTALINVQRIVVSQNDIWHDVKKYRCISFLCFHSPFAARQYSSQSGIVGSWGNVNRINTWQGHPYFSPDWGAVHKWWRHLWTAPKFNQTMPILVLDLESLKSTGWQKLAAFRRGQKLP